MSWKRALGTVAAQTGACGALLSLPDDVRDDVGVAPGVGAIYAAGAGTCYALRPVAAESIATRVAWYGLFAGPVSGSLAMGVAAYAASLILPPTSPLPPESQARLTAALRERDLGSLAGARHLPPETVAHLWHEALSPFLEDEGCDATTCGPFAPAVAQIQRRPAARAARARLVGRTHSKLARLDDNVRVRRRPLQVLAWQRRRRRRLGRVAVGALL